MKYLLITDIPAPWREKVYENIFRELGTDFHVAYCNHNEKRRLWNFPLGNHPKTFFKGITLTGIGEKENYVNFGVIPFLIKNRPKIIVCFSFVPTVVFAALLGKLLGCKIGVFADTWLGRDKKISQLQKMLRKLMYGIIPDAYIGASKQTLNMFRNYNPKVFSDQLFLSSLCADNAYFKETLKEREIHRIYDLMFAGRIVDLKNPKFFAQVAVKVKKKLGHCRVLVIGDGDTNAKEGMFQIFRKNEIEYDFPGFIKHADLPDYYSRSKLLLMPTSADCWGVVINEAMVCGVPVITTAMTAAAGELVKDGLNGYVLPLDTEVWGEKCADLLENLQEWELFSKYARTVVEDFNFENAAEGIISAFDYLEKSIAK